MSRFGLTEQTVELDGEEFTLRALKVRELEGLVAEYGEDDERGLSAAIIRTSSTDGKLADVTADELGEWPMALYRKIQAVVQELNNLGELAKGN